MGELRFSNLNHVFNPYLLSLIAPFPPSSSSSPRSIYLFLIPEVLRFHRSPPFACRDRCFQIQYGLLVYSPTLRLRPIFSKPCFTSRIIQCSSGDPIPPHNCTEAGNGILYVSASCSSPIRGNCYCLFVLAHGGFRSPYHHKNMYRCWLFQYGNIL